MTVDVNLLPLGVTSFKEFIQENCIYIDKTDLIASIAKSKAPCFLSRPRRFGKSTLVDTLQELFANGLTNFKGLKIEKDKLWDEKIYKVLHLDFSDLKECQNITFQEKFILTLELAFSDIDISLDKTSKQVDICFEKALKTIKDEKIVLLIDEYDAPLTESLDNKEEFNLRRSVLASFFSKVKKLKDKFRFIFITGVTRYLQTSIFSAFNNLKDLTFNPKYGTLVGYTQEELEYYFKDYIENAAVALNEKYHTTEYNYDVIVQKLKEYYDGYSFDSEALTHVYNPWSILNFLKNPEVGFESYWLETGGAKPSLLMKYLNSRNISTDNKFLNSYLNLDFTTSATKSSLSPAVVDISDANFSLEAILYQAGYLSIKTGNGEDFNIGIPNLEVKKAYATIILEIVKIFDSKL